MLTHEQPNSVLFVLLLLIILTWFEEKAVRQTHRVVEVTAGQSSGGLALGRNAQMDRLRLGHEGEEIKDWFMASELSVFFFILLKCFKTLIRCSLNKISSSVCVFRMSQTTNGIFNCHCGSFRLNLSFSSYIRCYYNSAPGVVGVVFMKTNNEHDLDRLSVKVAAEGLVADV